MHSLDKKYRPKTFDDIVGHKDIIAQLQRQIKNNAIGTCYLFSGKPGIGITSMARAFADALTEEEIIEENVGLRNGVDDSLETCDEIDRLLGEQKKPIILVEDCQLLTQCSWRVYKDFMDRSEKALFLLCTNEPEKIPDYISSRAYSIYLSEIPELDIERHLLHIMKMEDYIVGEEDMSVIANVVASVSHGDLRKSIVLLEQYLSSNYERQ